MTGLPQVLPLTRAIARPLQGSPLGPAPLVMDFRNPASVDGQYTFTRASGGGRFNAQGQYEWLPANEPRIDYDPVTGECRGLLIEGQATNLTTHSSGFTGGSSEASDVVVTDNSAASPTGEQNACTIEFLNGNAKQYRSDYVVDPAGKTFTYSVWLRADSPCRVVVRIASLGVPEDTILPVDVTTEWKRYSVTRSFALSGTHVRFGLDNRVAQGGVGVACIVKAFGSQLEQSAIVTSYIPTTTAQVTRAADIASVNELSPWYRSDEGTLLADVELRNVGGLGILGLRNSSASAERVSVYQNGNFNNYQAQVVSGGTTQAQLAYGVTVKGFGKFALAMKKDSFAVSSNGSVPNTDSAGLIPVGLDYMEIGNGYALKQINGHIRSIRYFPRRLSDAELQAITA